MSSEGWGQSKTKRLHVKVHTHSCAASPSDVGTKQSKKVSFQNRNPDGNPNANSDPHPAPNHAGVRKSTFSVIFGWGTALHMVTCRKRRGKRGIFGSGWAQGSEVIWTHLGLKPRPAKVRKPAPSRKAVGENAPSRNGGAPLAAPRVRERQGCTGRACWRRNLPLETVKKPSHLVSIHTQTKNTNKRLPFDSEQE